ncbi:glycosyltransferase family 9 protein [Natronospira bacteriovora]|uniref:Glycosyltransferase family 9 protein n=1 Tax=Natronospira bacteriovora TaxID=3069753 RepID=A0ABU0W6G4_9GAMM|nr:glycosyltransferase family 9 protein [Natronospira sp. AB-CW4]MDQ2069618.1 glycosyltransferase family 9 protein [Natronospira sp. AB-CW4]
MTDNHPSIQAPDAIAMLRLSAIGDVCHTVPVLRALQDRWPETAITWVIGRLEASLVGDIDGVEFISFDKKAGLGAYRALRHSLARRRFDALLHMQVALRASAASLLIPAHRRIGFDRERARDYQWLFTRERIPPAPRAHVMDGLLAFAAELDADISRPRWDIPVPDTDEAFARRHIPEGRPTLLISPCSSQRARNFRDWRAERYARVIEHAAREHGMATLITGGPTERERAMAAAIEEEAECPVTSLVGETSLKQLFALIRRATAVLCPDSGPAHMGTAAGTPVIGLYASSNPDRTGPYFSRQWCVNRYPEALLAETGKTVEEVRWGTRVRNPEVMDRIEVEDVVEKLDGVVSGEW